MAKIVTNLTDAYGNVHSGSYWRIEKYQVNIPELYCSFDIYGYVNKESRDVNKKPIDFKTYEIRGADFVAAMTQEMVGEKNTREVLYGYLSGVKDVFSGYNVLNSGEFNETMESVYTSFFNGSIDDI